VTAAARIVDLRGTDVEQMVGAHLLSSGSLNPGLVVLRVHGSGAEIVLGHIPPSQARELAGQLLEAAARAEYEGDFLTAATRAGFDNGVIGGIINLIRHGEFERCTAEEDR
jgi:hypothetical protein